VLTNRLAAGFAAVSVEPGMSKESQNLDDVRYVSVTVQ